MLAIDLAAQLRRAIDEDLRARRDALEGVNPDELHKAQGLIGGLREARKKIGEIMKRNEEDDDDD